MTTTFHRSAQGLKVRVTMRVFHSPRLRRTTIKTRFLERSALLRAGLRRKEACSLLFTQHLRTNRRTNSCAYWFDMLGYSIPPFAGLVYSSSKACLPSFDEQYLAYFLAHAGLVARYRKA